jgi:hypothetical protein
LKNAKPNTIKLNQKVAAMKKHIITIWAMALMLAVAMPLSAQIGNLKNVKKNVPGTKQVTETVKKSASSEKSEEPKSEAKTSEKTSATATPPESKSALYVSIASGKNQNDGSKESPLKNIDKAIATAQPGGEIRVAGGVYMGTLNVGFIESNKPVKIYGSFDETFTTQDIATHPTVIQPSNESARSTRKAVFKFTKDVKGTVIDNLVFDGGERNAYHADEGMVEGVEGGRMLPETERPKDGNSTVHEPLLQFMSATTGGDVTVQNCIFVNGASFALQAGHRSGKFTVKNNVFIANKMAAIEIYGTCASTGGPNTMALCGEVEVANNTILFTWSRTKDFLDMGYGVRIMTKLDYNIHNNIIGGSILAAIDHTRFNKNEWIKVDNNIFFVNKDKDFHYSPASNTRLRIDAADFGDIEIASVEGNKNEIPAGLKINKAYLEGYLSARYSEQADFDRNSQANQWRSAMGMNMQGTISSSVTMFGNKYPWREASKLFGNVSGYGAQ